MCVPATPGLGLCPHSDSERHSQDGPSPKGAATFLTALSELSSSCRSMAQEDVTAPEQGYLLLQVYYPRAASAPMELPCTAWLGLAGGATAGQRGL